MSNSQASAGNIRTQILMGISVSTPSVGANTSVIQTYAVPNLRMFDLVDAQPQSHVAGLTVAAAWVTTAGVLTVQFGNLTTGTIGVQSNYQIILEVSRCDADSMGFNYLLQQTAL